MRRGGNNNTNNTRNNNNKGDTSLGDAFRKRRNMNNGRSGSARNSFGSNSNSHQQAVMEQGSIRSLKESFGFIYCANRAEELFFHFSQVQNMRATDLKVNDEVEFRVGTARESNENSKQAAYSVVRLRPGTVVWETEDEPGMRFQGIVEKPVRLGRDGTTVQQEGVIRVLELVDGAEVTATGPPVKFTPSDYESEEKEEQPEPTPVEASENSPDMFRRSSAVGRAELMRRSSSSTALEKQNQRNRLGVQDLVEFTLVTSKRDKSQYARNIALLQSHREHQRLLREERLLATATKEQGVVTLLKSDYGFIRSNKRREEVYFHYSKVDLGDINEDNDYELKAGQEMEFLVVTEDNGRVSAREVKFLNRGSVEFHKFLAEGVMGIIDKCPQPAGGGNSDEISGRIRLLESIMDADKEVKVIDFNSTDSPGGSFSVRDGSQHLWIREGDTLLFDVIKESADESIRVFPTKKEVVAVGKNCDLTSTKQHQSTKLVQADLDAMLITSRSVKLVSCNAAGRSEGTINVMKDQFGFLHCSERPVDSYFKLFELLPEKLQKDLRRGMGICSEDKTSELTAGAEVQFDLSLQKSSQSKPNNGKQQEKEQLKAQRLLLLPPNTIVKTKVLAKGIKGVVQKEDPRQTYSGMMELDEEVQTMTLEERHPYVYKVVQSMLNDESIPSIVFPEAQSVKEDDVVMDLVETLGKGKLNCSHLPTSDPRGNSRLIIRRGSDDEDPEGEGRRKKKKILKPKEVKTIHFDKHCLLKEFQEGYPPCEGDTIVCDVIQVRRTRVVQLTNVKIVERNEKLNVEETEETGEGLVTDYTPSRRFGFISVLTDENASKREALFFQQTGNKIRKGDEVKFHIGLKKGGKRVAMKIEVVPKGSLGISTKASKNACHGYVLMEPSHTSLEDRDSGGRNQSPVRAGNSRWEKVDMDRNTSKKSSNANNEGLLLLTQDPTKMFEGQTILKFRNGAIALSGIGSGLPHRGDSISFVKGNNQAPRDIRVVAKNSATLLRGNLTDIDAEKETATFTADNDNKKYDVVLKDVVSCEKKMLNQKSEPVEGLVHDGKLYGICRTKDLFLDSKIEFKGKERPKLNLTVRRGLGGKIQAQSMMAKGPDKTIGFEEGWTKRISQYATLQE